MLTLSTASIIEKNKISSTGAWVMAIELHHPEGNILLVNNTEDLTLAGKKYTAFPFKLEDINEDTKQMPNVKLSVANVTGTIQRLVEKNKGLTDCEVNIRIFNTNLPDIIELEETFIINASQSKADWVVFTLGTDFSFSRRFPPVRVMKDYCPFKFKSVECGYKGYVQPKLQSLFGGVVSGIGAIGAGRGGVSSFASGSSFSSAFTGNSFGKFASGGIAPAGMTLVGENGPELLQFNSSHRIYNASQTRKMIGGEGANKVTVNIINQSGQQLDSQQQETKFDGEQMIVDVVVSSLMTNKGGMRDAIKAAAV